ncbi:MAG: hypothetical protein ABEK04_03530 [Candidatus Nanohalobium sp.]
MPMSNIITILSTYLFLIAAGKDIKDQAVWKGLGNLILLSGLTVQYLNGSGIELLLLGPAIGWIAEHQRLWTHFDTKVLAGLMMLNPGNTAALLGLLLPCYLIWAVLWKKTWPRKDLPVVPVFTVMHLGLLFL